MKTSLKNLGLVVSLCAALAASGCATHGTSLGTKIDDTVITTKIKAALYDDPSVRGSAVSVETVDGVVQLSGFVRSHAEANRAVEIARRVDNVTLVQNRMTVRN
jgi:hyperosmotically inducible protein